MSGIDPSDPDAVRRRLDGLRSEFAGPGSGGGLLRSAAALFRELFGLAGTLAALVGSLQDRLAEEAAKTGALRDRPARCERRQHSRSSERHPDIGGGSDAGASPDAGEDGLGAEAKAGKKPRGGVGGRRKDRGDAVGGSGLRFGPDATAVDIGAMPPEIEGLAADGFESSPSARAAGRRRCRSATWRRAAAAGRRRPNPPAPRSAPRPSRGCPGAPASTSPSSPGCRATGSPGISLLPPAPDAGRERDRRQPQVDGRPGRSGGPASGPAFEAQCLSGAGKLGHRHGRDAGAGRARSRQSGKDEAVLPLAGARRPRRGGVPLRAVPRPPPCQAVPRRLRGHAGRRRLRGLFGACRCAGRDGQAAELPAARQAQLRGAA